MRSYGFFLLFALVPFSLSAQFYVTDNDGKTFLLRTNEFTDEWEEVDELPTAGPEPEYFSPFGLVKTGEHDQFEEFSPGLGFFLKRMLFPAEIVGALRPGAGKYRHVVMESAGNIVVTCERGSRNFLCLVLHPWSTQLYLPEKQEAFDFEDIRSVVPALGRRGAWLLDGKGRMILFDVGDGGRGTANFTYPARAEMNPPPREIAVQMTPGRADAFRYLLRFDGEPFFGTIDFTKEQFEPIDLPYGFAPGPKVRFHPRYSCADLIVD